MTEPTPLTASYELAAANVERLTHRDLIRNPFLYFLVAASIPISFGGPAAADIGWLTLITLPLALAAMIVLLANSANASRPQLGTVSALWVFGGFAGLFFFICLPTIWIPVLAIVAGGIAAFARAGAN